MTPEEFEEHLKALRPRLHRFCARMTGSTIDGEDVVQDALLKALRALNEGLVVENLEGWLLRIAHNASLDLLRSRNKAPILALAEPETDPWMEQDLLVVSFRTFMQLPELQRCAVILKDVLGHSVEEIAVVADCTPVAAKSALQRGRAGLKKLIHTPEDFRLPLMSDSERQKIAQYVQHFQNGEFDAIRALLADDVKLDLANRLKLTGRSKVDVYFTRYAEVRKWRFALGAVEGRPAMLVFDSEGTMEKPSHFVLLEWRDQKISHIQDTLFATYMMEGTDWTHI